MRLLTLKALRDVRRQPLAFLASALMLSAAVALFVAFDSAQHDLDRSTRATYAQLRFLDFTLNVREANERDVERVRELAGVNAAEGRRSVGARLLLPNGQTRGLMLGIPLDHRPAVNDVALEEGHYPTQRGECLLESRYARLHGLHPGDLLTARLDTFAPHKYRIVGLVHSPEFLWLVDDQMDPRPSARRLGVVFLSHADVAELCGRAGFNEIHATVQRGFRVGATLREAERRLERVRSRAGYTRGEQASHALLVRDRRAFQTISVLFPWIFLSASLLTLLSSITHLVRSQRKQVGVLMAQGVSELSILMHYLTVGLLSVTPGAVLGLIGGHFLGELCTGYYARSLGLPGVTSGAWLPWQPALVTVASCALAAATAWLSTRQLLSREPAEVLRAEFTPTQRSPRLERWLPFLSRLNYTLRLPVRNLARQPLRSVTVVAGLTCAHALLIMSLGFFDSQRNALDYYFGRVHTYDLQVDLRRAISLGQVPPIASWPGVRRMESYLRTGLLLRRGEVTLYRGIWGIPEDAVLLRTFSPTGQLLKPSEALWMGPVLREALHAGTGDTLQAHVPTSSRTFSELPIEVGPSIYEPVANPPKMALSALQRLVAAQSSTPPDAVNILLLKVDSGSEGSVTERLYSLPEVRDVSDLVALQEDIRDLLRMVTAYFSLMLGFSVVLAGALVFGTTSLSIAERRRELATLSLLGVRESQLAAMLALEIGWMWAGGLALGAPLGYLLGAWLLGHYQRDLLQLTPTLNPVTVALVGAIGLAVCLVSGAFALREALSVPLTESTQDPG